jgi:hypothetical protein
MDFKKTICKLATIRQDLDTCRFGLFKKYPNMNKELDSRLTFFNQSATIIDTAIISIILLDDALLNDNWWKRTPRKYGLNQPPVDSLFPVISGYKGFTMFHYFISLFSVFESSVRTIAVTIDPKYKEYRSVDCIFKSLAKRVSIQRRHSEINPKLSS